MRAVATIEFMDFLSATIEVDGFELGATVNVVLRKYSDGTLDIDSMEVGKIYQIHPFYDLIPFCERWLETPLGTRLRERFINACELLALNKAKATADYKWNEIEREESA